MFGNSLALDTKAYSDWQRGEAWEEKIDAATEIYVPFVVVAELHAGFSLGTIGRKNIEILTRFLGNSEVSVSFPDETTLEIYANLFGNLKRKGTPIPTNDIWIASCCIQHNIPLAASDQHFR